ncbi:uncharacterized protein LOC143829398 isoform X2 [Paroedura picta]|uniref:uncharacterized protein LOC143829398 isoform X2 n=1 Tax=Paroedura picta TaxID=143630 RepID=UPI004057C573
MEFPNSLTPSSGFRVTLGQSHCSAIKTLRDSGQVFWCWWFIVSGGLCSTGLSLVSLGPPQPLTLGPQAPPTRLFHPLWTIAAAEEELQINDFIAPRWSQAIDFLQENLGADFQDHPPGKPGGRKVGNPHSQEMLIDQ